MSEHTPGPWKYNGVKSVEAPDGRVLVVLQSAFADNAMADARLIAASPTMYELLKDARDHILDLEAEDGYNGEGFTAGHIRALLAKIEAPQ